MFQDCIIIMPFSPDQQACPGQLVSSRLYCNMFTLSLSPFICQDILLYYIYSTASSMEKSVKYYNPRNFIITLYLRAITVRDLLVAIYISTELQRPLLYVTTMGIAMACTCSIKTSLFADFTELFRF